MRIIFVSDCPGRHEIYIRHLDGALALAATRFDIESVGPPGCIPPLPEFAVHSDRLGLGLGPTCPQEAAIQSDKSVFHRWTGNERVPPAPAF